MGGCARGTKLDSCCHGDDDGPPVAEPAGVAEETRVDSLVNSTVSLCAMLVVGVGVVGVALMDVVVVVAVVVVSGMVVSSGI